MVVISEIAVVSSGCIMQVAPDVIECKRKVLRNMPNARYPLIGPIGLCSCKDLLLDPHTLLLPTNSQYIYADVNIPRLPRYLQLRAGRYHRACLTNDESEDHDRLQRGPHKRSGQGITIDEASVQDQSFIT